jgi:hypothetical protein
MLSSARSSLHQTKPNFCAAFHMFWNKKSIPPRYQHGQAIIPGHQQVHLTTVRTWRILSKHTRVYHTPSWRWYMLHGYGSTDLRYVWEQYSAYKVQSPSYYKANTACPAALPTRPVLTQNQHSPSYHGTSTASFITIPTQPSFYRIINRVHCNTVPTLSILPKSLSYTTIWTVLTQPVLQRYQPSGGAPPVPKFLLIPTTLPWICSAEVLAGVSDDVEE